MKRQEKYELLANFISLFGNNNWILSKFLIDNNAINISFLNKINIDSKDEISDDFKSIDDLNTFLNSLISKKKENRQIDLEEKLSDLIKREKYEEAAKIRDWINKLKNRKD